MLAVRRYSKSRYGNDVAHYFANPLCLFQAFYIGEGDLHEEAYSNIEVVIPFSDLVRPELTETTPGHCLYSFHVFPTKEFEESYRSKLLMRLTVVVAMTFVFMAVTFYMYDWFVQRRNIKVVGAAACFNAIVSSMFPSIVRDRLYAENKEKAALADANNKSRLKNFLVSEAPDSNDEEHDDIMYKTKPITDVFPETTILFADISGFTA